MSDLLEVAKSLKAKSSSRKEDMTKVYEKELTLLEQSLKSKLNSSVNELDSYTRQQFELMMANQKETMNNLKLLLDERIENLNQELMKTKFLWSRVITRNLIVGLSISAGLFLGSFGMMKYLSSNIIEMNNMKYALQTEIAQLESKGAWGLSYQKTEKGNFVTIPSGFTEWKCGESPCIRIN